MRTLTEHEHQVMLIKWFDLQHKEFAGRLFAIPNGGQRHVIVAAKLKAEGVRKGVPDLFLPVPRGNYHGLFIELKRIGKGATTEQAEWLDYLSDQGYKAALCRGFDAAKAVIEEYLGKTISK